MMHEMMMTAMLVFYVVTAYCLMVIAQKTGHEDKGWWAFIPILNLLLIIYIAGKEWWWLALGVIISLILLIISFFAMDNEMARHMEETGMSEDAIRERDALFGYGRGTRETGLDGASLYLLDRVPDSGIH
jgi:hypothetical protein